MFANLFGAEWDAIVWDERKAHWLSLTEEEYRARKLAEIKYWLKEMEKEEKE